MIFFLLKILGNRGLKKDYRQQLFMTSTVEKAGLCALCFSYLIAKSHSEFMS